MHTRPVTRRSSTNPECQAKPLRRRSRWLSLGIAAAALIPVFPAGASAADYCVAPNASCGGTNVATFEQALDLADNATDADRIFLGTATYTAPTTSGYAYVASNSPVEIIGQGAGSTVLTSPAGGTQQVLYLDAGAGSSVQGLTIRLPQNAAAGTSALYTNAPARQISVIEDPTQANYRYGMTLLSGGSLEDSTVTLAGEHHATAVVFDGGTAVRRSQLSAGTGVLSYGGTIERSRVDGSEYGIKALGGQTTISASVVRLTGSYGTAIDAGTEPTGDTAVSADGDTIVVPPTPDVIGVGVTTANSPANSADLSLTNSIIRGAANSLFANGSGSGHATLKASYSDYDPSGDVVLGANATIGEANVSNAGDARFADATTGDYHLRADSPLIDRGDPATPQGLDFDANPLVADGDGDAIARRDLGAFELAPAVSAAGQTTSAAGAPATDTQAPLVSGFMATPSRFAIAATPATARLQRGTHLHYTLSEQARVTVTIQRALSGRRQSARCVRATPQLRRAKHCTRYRNLGTLTGTAQAGANSTRFTGKLNKRALKPGGYRAVIIATDAAGNRSAPKRARFHVIASNAVVVRSHERG